MINDEPIRFDYPLNEDSIVWDCGGYEGKFAEGIWHKFHCNIVVFEPVQEYSNAIGHKFKDMPKVIAIAMAIGGDAPGPVLIRCSNNSTGAFSAGKEILVHKIPITQLLAEHTSPIDLIKLNIEGMEFELLEAVVNTELIKRFKNIQVQWHDCAPNAQVRYDELQKALALTHELTWDQGWVWQNWRLK